MNDGWGSSRGQVLIIFVFAIIGLIAIAGLAIDGSNIYSERRRAQNAADTAVLAASLARNTWEKDNGDCTGTLNTETGTIPGCASSAVNNALNIAGQNGYDNNPANNNRVFLYSPPIDGYYATCSNGDCDPTDYVEVVISNSVNTWFAPIVGMGQLQNKVEAVALAKYVPQTALYGGASLVQLDKTGCGFDLGGNAKMTLNGGAIFVNSKDGSCAFEQNPCKPFYLNDGAQLKVVGKMDSKCSPPPDYTVVPVSGQYAFPPQPLISPAPAECSQAYVTKKVSGKWPAGHYTDLPSGKLAGGVYCVDKVKTTNSDNTDGTAGVFIYVKNGSFEMDGGTFNLVAMTSGQYAGYLIYYYPAARDNKCKLNGGSAQTLTGLVYLPYCDLTINGDSSPTGLTTQIVAATFKWTGNSTDTFWDASGVIPQNPEVDKTGLYH